MAKPKIPNQKKKYDALNKRLSNYVSLVRQIYDALNLEAAKMAERVRYEGEKPFSFSDYPELRESLSKLKKSFVMEMQALIYSGTTREWKESNLVQDLIADKVLKTYGVRSRSGRYKKYYQTNTDALKAFQERKDRGMNLSKKLWNQSQDYKTELEYAISSAIQKGTSAVTLSKRVSKYLQNFDSLQKDYKERFGKAVTCNDCEYRSIRLARSEINMAYRTAEQKRWEQMDFVVGYEIKLSHSHHDKMPHGDICDDLAGKYPKDFKWTGWHPNDMCYVIPILKTEEEFWADEDVTSKNEVTDTPQQFKDWVNDNKERIKKAKSRGTLPYFVNDNNRYVIINKVKKPFILTNLEDLKNLGYEFKSVGFAELEGYNKSSIRGFDIIDFDKKIKEICEEYSIILESKKIETRLDGISKLIYKGENSKGEEFELIRRFVERKGSISVEHEVFVIPESIQGKGMSKKLFKELFSQYENMGIDKIELFANLDVGGYAWAKYGFSTEKSNVKAILKYSLRKGKLSEEEFNFAISVIEKYDDDEMVPMNLIANTQFGKKLLLKTSWAGEFDMKEKKQLAYLKDYIGF